MPTHRTIASRLHHNARAQFVGRHTELERLVAALDVDGPRVTHVSGIAGIGKSSLIAQAAARMADLGVECIHIECRFVEPTEAGFCETLAQRLDSPAANPAQLANTLASRPGRVALILDNYEHFLLLDAWLRGSFVPVQPDNLRIFLCGRMPPHSRWLTEPGWQGLFQAILLGPLTREEARDLLIHQGMPPRAAQQTARFAHGHPLALQLIAPIARNRPELRLEAMDLQQALQCLSETFLADVPDATLRNALEAVSVARRITASLLARLIPETDADHMYVRLSTLPFVDVRHDGLMLHEVVRSAIADALRARDPARYLTCRRQAWLQLCSEAGPSGRAALWRYTADMLFLIENPVVREAFFPIGAPTLSVAPMSADERPAVSTLIAAHEPADAAAALETWLTHLPQTFSTVHRGNATVTGFYIACDARQVAAPVTAVTAVDAVAAAWAAHLQQHPVAPGERVLWCRRWLSRSAGEAPSDEQAAVWLDLKRVYMEMRPNLRRIYLTVTDLTPYGPAATQLGFTVLPTCTVRVAGAHYQTAMLDFGPASVDGWLARLAANELGIEQHAQLLDASAHELVVDGQRTHLTPLEFGVMQHLSQRHGHAVSRRDLLQHVWGTDYEGGSNVVDAVVRGIRKKLNKRAHMIETVTGVGYRLRS